MVKRRKKDYQKKNLNNPFFPKKTGQEGKGSFVKLKLLFFLVVFFSGIYFFLVSDYFLFKNVTVNGNNRISSSEVRGVVDDQAKKKRFLVFSQKNIFLFSKKSAIKELASNPLLGEAKINRKLPNTLAVTITEKSSGLIWAINNDQYYLDLNGIVLRPIDQSDLVIEKTAQGTDIVRPESSSGNYPLIYDLSNEPVEVGKPVTSAELAQFIVGLSEEVKSTSDLDISHFTIIRPYFPEVTLMTKEGWEVRFKISDDFTKQARILNSILEQEIKDRRNLEYIDLRFGEKVFYK